jgi:hypothetical protein
VLSRPSTASRAVIHQSVCCSAAERGWATLSTTVRLGILVSCASVQRAATAGQPWSGISSNPACCKSQGATCFTFGMDLLRMAHGPVLQPLWLSRYYPFGLNLIMDLRRLAPPPMSLDLSLQRRVGPHALDCQLVVAPAPGAGPEGAGMAADSSFTLVCGCVNTDTLLLWRHVVPAQLHQQLEVRVPLVLCC